MNYGKAKFLFLDLETAPNTAAIWSCGYKMNVGPESLIQERFIISAQWSWNNDKVVHGILSNIKKACDKQLIKKLAKVIAKADVVIGHNIKKFDARWLEGRALLNGLPPTGLPFKVMYDTMKLAKTAFSLNSYKMDYLAKVLGIPGKIKTSYSDWMDVLVRKDVSAAEGLLRYGKHDIVMNRLIFEKLLPYVKFPGNINRLIFGSEVIENKWICTCGSDKMHKHDIKTTKKAIYQRYRCNSCGSVHQIDVKEDV